MIVIGIDPGSSGGVAWVSDSVPGLCEAFNMPETARDVFDLLDSLILRNPANVHAFIERITGPAMKPGRNLGSSSTFKFGRNVGMLHGVLTGLKVPYEEVLPAHWQKALGCLTKGDKNVSKAKAQQLFPSLKITHAKADALLIAEYGRRTMRSHSIERTEPE